jgi:hypothetical protein
MDATHTDVFPPDDMFVFYEFVNRNLTDELPIDE